MQEVYKRHFKEYFHEKDSLLSEITFEDVIITAQSNESVIDEKSITRVFNEILKQRIEDAKIEFRQNVKQLVKESQG